MKSPDTAPPLGQVTNLLPGLGVKKLGDLKNYLILKNLWQENLLNDLNANGNLKGQDRKNMMNIAELR